MTVDELTAEDLEFACSCGAEAAEKCDLVRAWAEERLDFAKRAERWPRASLSTAIIADLHWSYRAGIDLVGYDQWGAVGVSTYQPKEGEPPEFSCYVEWDAWEDGLAYVLRRFFLRYGDRRESSDREPQWTEPEEEAAE